MRALPVLIAAPLALCFAANQGAHADAVIAVAAPLSGPHLGMGEDVRRGAEAVVQRLNAEGGVLGERLTLIFEDDGCENARALVAAQSAVAAKPAAVVGHPCSNAAVAAAPEYVAAGIVFISPGARHGALTAPRAGDLPPRASGDSSPRASGATARRVFRLAGRDDRQGEAAALWLAGAAPERRIAFIRDGSRYARDLAERAEKIWRGNGTASAPLFAIETGREDYSDVAARVAALKPEAVFFAGFPMEAAIFLRGLRRAGQRARFLGSDSLAGDIFGGAAGPEPENVRVLLPNDPAPREGWRPQEIADLNRYPEASRGLMGRTYGAIEAWAEATRRSGSLTPDAVSAALMAGPIETAALGPISFDENGDARVPSYAAAHWNGMHWVPGD